MMKGGTYKQCCNEKLSIINGIIVGGTLATIIINIFYTARHGEGAQHKPAFVWTEKSLEWWQSTIIYQIYPRSFQDSDGDGIGDIKGITSRLDYLTYLTIGTVWLSPIYESPMADFGYDISNHTRIDPIFGTMDDFAELVNELQKREIRILMDYVPNHTSDQHPWFRASCRSNASDNNYRDYYIWHDGITSADGMQQPPNNWNSFFSGSAWTWSVARKQFYLHQYAVGQPDLNWRNKDVINEMQIYMRFWFDKGVDGFRMDAVQTLFESPDLLLDEPRSHKENKQVFEHDYLHHIHTQNLDEVHDIMHMFSEIAQSYTRLDGKKRLLISEVYDEDISEVMKFYESGSDMAFYFDLMKITPTSGGYGVQKLVDRLLSELPEGKWPNFVLGNHDTSRIASRLSPHFVNLLNILLLLLPGTPTTYQGEELGMQNIEVTWEQTRDPLGINYGPLRYQEVSRDPVRSPMQWTDGHMAGFTKSPEAWLPIHPDYKTQNAVLQQTTREYSPLQIYKELSSLHQEPSFQTGNMSYGLVNHNIFSFIRTKHGHDTFFVIMNVGSGVAIHDFSGCVNAREGIIVLNSGNFRSGLYDIGLVARLEEVLLEPGQAIVVTVK